MVFSIIIHLQTKQKLENGYEFFLSFLSVLVNASTFIFFMLVVISQEERKPKDPFYLFRYVSYVFLFLLAIAPFIYLWSMQDVIMHLNLDKPFRLIQSENGFGFVPMMVTTDPTLAHSVFKSAIAVITPTFKDIVEQYDLAVNQIPEAQAQVKSATKVNTTPVGATQSLNKKSKLKV